MGGTVGELQAGDPQLPAPLTEAAAQAQPGNSDDRSLRRNRWRLVCVAVFATLIAACGGPPSAPLATSSSASVHPLGSASAKATATSSKEASPTASTALSSPGQVQPTSHQSSLSNPTTGTVPNVLGTTLAEARSALYAAGFGKYSWLYSCYGSSNIGKVVKQSPGAGAQVALTTHLQLYLQAENCTATVPNVIGMSLSAAISTLQQAGFPHVHWIFECLGSSNGTVVIQSPTAGTSYGTNETVDLQAQAENCLPTATPTA